MLFMKSKNIKTQEDKPCIYKIAHYAFEITVNDSGYLACDEEHGVSIIGISRDWNTVKEEIFDYLYENHNLNGNNLLRWYEVVRLKFLNPYRFAGVNLEMKYKEPNFQQAIGYLWMWNGFYTEDFDKIYQSYKIGRHE